MYIGALGGEARWGPKVSMGGCENRGPTGSGATSAWLGGFRVGKMVRERRVELPGSFSGCFFILVVAVSALWRRIARSPKKGPLILIPESTHTFAAAHVPATSDTHPSDWTGNTLTRRIFRG